MPASNARALEKARTLAADAFIFDLEDAVAPESKSTARAQAVATVRNGGFGGKPVLIRINGLGTAWFHDDINAAAMCGAYAVLVPKVQTALDVAQVDAALASAGAPPDLKIWSMIESPRAVMNLAAIAGSGGRHSCLVAGFADLAKDLNTRDVPDRTPLTYALSAIVMAARAHGLIALDGVYPPFTDAEGCRAEAAQARAYGYDGKTLIHPSQIDIANAVFSPSADELAKAREIVAAYETALAAGTGVAVLNGKMVEVLHAAQARALLAAHDH